MNKQCADPSECITTNRSLVVCQYFIICDAALNLPNLPALDLPNLPSLNLPALNPTNLPFVVPTHLQPTHYL